MQKEFADIVLRENNPRILYLGADYGVMNEANIVPQYKYFFYPNIAYQLYPQIGNYQKELIKKKDPLFIVLGNKSYYYNLVRGKVIRLFNEDQTKKIY